MTSALNVGVVKMTKKSFQLTVDTLSNAPACVERQRFSRSVRRLAAVTMPLSSGSATRVATKDAMAYRMAFECKLAA